MIFCLQRWRVPDGQADGGDGASGKDDPAKGKRPIRIGDGDGLYLQVAPGDTKSWLLRYTLRGKVTRNGLGPVGEPPDGVPLAKARIRLPKHGRCSATVRTRWRSDKRRGWLGSGPKPRPASAPSARRLRPWWTASGPAGGTPSTQRNGWPHLKAHAFPVIGDLPVAAIGTDEVLRVLRPIWERIPETASRVRQRIEAVLDAARVKGWRTGENPARWKGHLAGELPQPRKVKRVHHRPALAWQDMGVFMAALGERDGIAALALRFVILTAARTGEVRGMRWREVDLDAKVWTVPGDRMKAGKLHRVALSAAALAVLAEVRPLMKQSGDLVFPGGRKEPLSDMALSEVVRRMNEGGEEGAVPRWRDAEGRAVVPHGFRSSFRDWAGETRPEGREVVEAALAHTIKERPRRPMRARTCWRSGVR